MTQEQKEWIDNASYEQLLSKWRFAPFKDPFFINDTGVYYEKIMLEKREQLSTNEIISISKKIGWEN